MSEGNVYICQSQRLDVGFRVWVVRRPSLSAQGWTLDEALEELGGVVCLATGDGEAVFELDSPAAGNAPLDHFVALSGNSDWKPPHSFTLEQFGTLYEGGVCKTCCTGIGPRTSVPLSVALLGKANLLFSALRMPSIMLASDRFRATLIPAERAMIEWVPLDVRGKSRRLFFEMRAIRTVRSVADKSKPVQGWRCPICKFACFSTDYQYEYVAKSDLGEGDSELVMIDNSHCTKPAIPYSRWTQIRGKPGAKNLVSCQVVPLPSARVRRRPDLRILTRTGARAMRRECGYMSQSAGI